jgi:hypothetical protein
MKFVYIILILFVSSSLIAQTDLENITKLYSSNKKISYSVTYKIKDLKDKALKDSLIGTFSSKGTDYYFQLGQTEYIYKEGLWLYINHAEKIIFIKNVPNKGLNANPGKQLKSLSEVLGNTISYEQVNNNEKKLTIRSQTQGEIVIWYNPKTFTINRIMNPSVINGQPVLLDIHYTNHTINAKKIPQDISQYIEKKNNKYSPTNKYKGYKLL